MVRKGKPSGTDPHFAELTRHLGFEYNGMILHEYYFSNLKRAADPAPAKGSGLAQAFEQNFGGAERWKVDFQAIGGMRGVGWAVLFQDPVTDRLVNHWISLHQDGPPAGFKPLLGVALGGCSLAGRTFGTYVDDKVITGSVRRGLGAEPPQGLPRVKIDTYEGTVYLSGEVETAAQKAEAEAAARRVEGVEQVINDLHVRTDAAAVSALPRMSAAGPLQTRLPGLRRIDPAPPGEGALAYDKAGVIVATVYVRPLRAVTEKGFDDIGPP